jgi:hypothetical protein
MYISFLLSEPKSTSCCRLGEIMNISHDSVNRFLHREGYSPLDLFEEVRGTLNLKGGTLSVDDTVLDKPYSQYLELVSHFWSGKHHRTVKGINLITLYYTDSHGQHPPVNFRVYDKREGKTKNDYFQEMLEEVLLWGLEPAFVTGDSWYSCEASLRLIKNHQLGLLFALESNRLVSVEKGTWIQAQQLAIPEDGLVVWLKQFGSVKLFRTRLKDQLRHYVIYLPNNEPLSSFRHKEFSKLYDQHWMIEQYHRAIKQVCHIEHFHVRGKVAIKNHLFAAICAYVQLQRLRAMEVISNCYRVQRELFNEVIASFIVGFMPTMQHLNPQFKSTI